MEKDHQNSPEKAGRTLRNSQNRLIVKEPQQSKQMLLVAEYALRFGINEASAESGLSTKDIKKWCKTIDEIRNQVSKDEKSIWEIWLLVWLKHQIYIRQKVTSGQLLQQAKELQMDYRMLKPTEEVNLTPTWLFEWSHKYDVVMMASSAIPQDIPAEELILHYNVTLKDSLITARLDQQQGKKVEKGAEQLEEAAKTRRTNRRFYSPSYKLVVAAYARQTSKSAASKKFGVERRRISEWIQERSTLEDMEQKGIMTKRRGMKPLSDELDRQVWKWYQQQLKRGNKPSQTMTQAKAKQIFHAGGHKSFKASAGWLNRWNARWATNDPTENTKSHKGNDECMEVSSGSDVPSETNSHQNKATEELDTNSIKKQLEKSMASESPNGNGEEIDDYKPTPSEESDQSEEADEAKMEKYVKHGAKRKSYTPAYKLMVTAYAEGATKAAAVRKFGVAKRRVAEWIQDKESLKEMKRKGLTLRGKRGVKPLSEELDQQLWEWYCNCKSRGKKLSKTIVQARARFTFDKAGHKNFKASEGWYRRWYDRWRRHELTPCKSLALNTDLCNVGMDSKELSIKASSEKVENINDNKSTAIKTGEFVERLQTGPNNELLTTDTSANLIPESSMVSDNTKTPAFSQELANGSSHASLPLGNSTGPLPEIQVNCHQPSPESAAVQNSAASNLKDLVQDYTKILDQISSYDNQEAEQQFDDADGCQTNQTEDVAASKNSSDHPCDEDQSPPCVPKKKGERYLPHFKLKVVNYATNHSFKKTSQTFGVHHATISEWCREKEKLEKLCNQAVRKVQAEPADKQFITWLKKCRLKNKEVTGNDIKQKAEQLIQEYGTEQALKSCRWFVAWLQRWTEKPYEEGMEDAEEDSRETHLHYPPALKLEIVHYAAKHSQNGAARVFNIARKRVFDWIKCEDKLEQLAKKGALRKQGAGRNVTSVDADREVWEWYSQLRATGRKPKTHEVRAKAVEVFKSHGHTNIKCSYGWFKRWCQRFGVQLRYENDDEILEWLLTRFENNQTATHHDLQNYGLSVIARDNPEFKASAGWSIRFCKRHPKLLQSVPSVEIPLPAQLEFKVSEFRKRIRTLQESNGYTLAAIGAMDEVPLSFSATGAASVSDGKRQLLMRRTGIENVQALVILSVLADGGVLPPLIIVKGRPPENSTADRFSTLLFYQDEIKITEQVLHRWLENVWLRHVPLPNLLVMDCYELHERLLQHCLVTDNSNKLTCAIIPGGCTSKLQPLDVHIKPALNAILDEKWQQYSHTTHSQHEGLPSVANNASKLCIPTPNEIIEWVTAAHERLIQQPESIRRSFLVTGITTAADKSEDHLVEDSRWVSKAERLNDSSASDTSKDE